MYLYFRVSYPVDGEVEVTQEEFEKVILSNDQPTIQLIRNRMKDRADEQFEVSSMKPIIVQCSTPLFEE